MTQLIRARAAAAPPPVRTYADNASSEEWTTLIGTLGRSDDPGVTCLRRAFAYVLAGVAAPDEGVVAND
jgi:hypothetical protein